MWHFLRAVARRIAFRRGMKESASIEVLSGRSVRWGLVGAGKVCEVKAGPPLYKVPGSELTLVNRRNAAAGEDFIRRHGHGTFVGSLEELVRSDAIDAVYIATPHALHAEQTILALEAGKPVLVEKPMALNAGDCERMVAAAAAAGRSLGVAYYRRGYPAVQRVRELMASGAIGHPLRASINNEFPTSHRLDLVHYLLGDIRAARRMRVGGDPFSFEAMAPRFEVETLGGTVVRMITPWSESGMPEALRIEGSAGVIDLHDLKGGHLVWENAEGRQHESAGSLPFTHWGLIANFVEHVATGQPLLCDGREGRKSTVILDVLAGAPETDEWVPVDYEASI